MLRRGWVSASLALREEVRRELALSGRQIAELEEILQSAQDEQRSSMRSLVRERLPDFRKMSNAERQVVAQQIQEEISQRSKRVRDKVITVLTPPQKTRFNELEFQFLVQSGDVMAALAVAGVDLDQDDQDVLREAVDQTRNKLREEIARITREMQLKALSTVMAEAQLQQLMGKPFQFVGRGRPSSRAAAGETERPASDEDGSGNGRGNVRRGGDRDRASPRRRNRRREPRNDVDFQRVDVKLR